MKRDGCMESVLELIAGFAVIGLAYFIAKAMGGVL